VDYRLDPPGAVAPEELARLPREDHTAARVDLVHWLDSASQYTPTGFREIEGTLQAFRKTQSRRPAKEAGEGGRRRRPATATRERLRRAPPPRWLPHRRHCRVRPGEGDRPDRPGQPRLHGRQAVLPGQLRRATAPHLRGPGPDREERGGRPRQGRPWLPASEDPLPLRLLLRVHEGARRGPVPRADLGLIGARPVFWRSLADLIPI